MSLLERIKADQLVARTEYNYQRNNGKMGVTATEERCKPSRIKVSLLTTLIGEAAMVGKNAGRDTTDAEVVAVIRKFLKGVDESLRVAGDYRDGDRVDELSVEKDILEGYLPRQMDKSELKRVLTQFNAENATKGVLMKFLKDNFAGQYDGKLAAEVVDGFLAK